MATYISLLNFTEQGIRNIKESPGRADAFARAARELGVEVKGQYWTMGSHDGVLIVDAPDDETASALSLKLCQSGNVKTRTLRAYDSSEMERVLGKV